MPRGGTAGGAGARPDPDGASLEPAEVGAEAAPPSPGGERALAADDALGR